MKLRQWLENWDMTSLKITAPFMEMEWSPKDEDKAAAWDLYVELLTRIATQPLDPSHGDEKTALDSIYSLFPITREILKVHTRECQEFTKIAIVVLNQIVRPFTAKWHRLSLQGAFSGPEANNEFRAELAALQARLKTFTKMLADMAGVEDLTTLEQQ
jgi:hypothetical protein